MKKIIVFTLLLIPIIATAQDSTYIDKLRLQPDYGHVWSGYWMHIRVIAELKNWRTNQPAGEAVGNHGWDFGWDYTPIEPHVTVNGIHNGNDEVGYIFISEGDGIRYIAPLDKPDKNSVEVKATYKNVNIQGIISDRTITCNFEIRGGFTMGLDPDTAWLRVNDTLPLTIVEENERVYWSFPYYLYYQHDTLRGEGWHLEGRTRTAPAWTVNGIPNGNNLVGEIIMNGPTLITFKAPIRIPVKNPVDVIAKYDSIYWNSGWRSKKLTAHIWIGDSDTTSENDEVKKDTMNIKKNVGGNRFEVKMVASIIGGSRDAWGGVVTYSDEGSFIVAVEADKAAVTNIKNNLEVLTNNCAKIITNPTTCTGILHVAGIKSTKVTPANPGQPYPIVEIWFVPHPTELTQFKFTCPPPPSARKSSIGKIDLSQMAMLSMFRMPALPPYIKFIAKNEEQILIEKGTPGGELYYKFSVRKVKDD